jgi:hypothetical protein
MSALDQSRRFGESDVNIRFTLGPGRFSSVAANGRNGAIATFAPYRIDTRLR